MASAPGLCSGLRRNGCAVSHRSRKCTGSERPGSGAIATDAYVYGYSLITTDVTRIRITNMPVAKQELHAPVNQFANSVSALGADTPRKSAGG